MENVLFLSSLSCFKPLSKSSLVSLRLSLRLFVVLRNAKCSFHSVSTSSGAIPSRRNDGKAKTSRSDMTHHDNHDTSVGRDGAASTDTSRSQNKSKDVSGKTLTYGMLFKDEDDQEVSLFSIDIVIGVSNDDNKKKTCPPSLYFRINDSFFLVDHTLIDEISYPKESSTLKKLPVATIKLENVLMRIMFPESGEDDVTRVEAVKKQAALANRMNKTLQCAVMTDHPVILADECYSQLFRIDEMMSNGDSHGTNSMSTDDDTSNDNKCNGNVYSSEDTTEGKKVNKSDSSNNIASKKRSYHDYNVQESATTMKESKALISQKLEKWAQSLELLDFLTQPVLKKKELALRLCGNDYINLTKDCTILLESSCEEGNTASGLVDLLKALAQAKMNNVGRKDLENLMSEEVAEIEQEVFESLNSLFDGTSAVRDRANSLSQDNKIRKLSQESNEFKLDELSYVNSQNSDEQFPPPIPLSQYTYEEKRSHFECMDEMIDNRLTFAIQNEVAVKLIPLHNDFSRTDKI